jgi:hypothetical protein
MNPWLAAILAVSGLYLGYRRWRHAQATARVADLRLYLRPESPSAYEDALRWLKRPKFGYYRDIAMKAIEPFVWLKPEWPDDKQPATVMVDVYVENLGNMMAKSVKFVMVSELPGIHLEVEGGVQPVFPSPGFDKFALIYKDLGNLTPGVPGQFTLRATLDSPQALFALLYRTEWTRVLGLPVAPPERQFYDDPSFPVLYWLASEDTRKQERIMLLTCCCTDELNRHLTVARLRAQAQETLAQDFNHEEFAQLVRACQSKTVRKLKADVCQYVNRIRRETAARIDESA